LGGKLEIIHPMGAWKICALILAGGETDIKLMNNFYSINMADKK